MAVNSLQGHLLVPSQNIHTHFQRRQGTAQVAAHQIGPIHRAVCPTHRQRSPGVQIQNTLAGGVAVGHNPVTIRRTVHSAVKQKIIDLAVRHRLPHSSGKIPQQTGNHIHLGRTVIGVHHCHRVTARGGNHINFPVHPGKRPIQNHHSKNRSAGRHIPGAGRNAVGGHHTGARVPLRGTKDRAGLQGTAGIQQRRPCRGQGACGRTHRQNLRQQIRQSPRVVLVRHQPVKGCQHFCVILPGSRVYGEHTGGIAHTQYPPTGKQVVHIPGQGIHG